MQQSIYLRTVTVQIPLENIKIPRHSCMLLAGIYTQHGFPIKHFGNDDIFKRVCEQLLRIRRLKVLINTIKVFKAHNTRPLVGASNDDIDFVTESVN